jgi:hypothetical protein
MDDHPYGNPNEQLAADNASFKELDSQVPHFVQEVHNPMMILGEKTEVLVDQAPLPDVLGHSNHPLHLLPNHLIPAGEMERARNIGIILGTRHANERGITSKTENMLNSNSKTAPEVRLNPREQQYVYSKLMQRNFNNRQCHSVFKSQTNRLTLGNNKHQCNPPPGLYEPKFLKSAEATGKLAKDKTKCVSPRELRAQIEDPDDWKDPKVKQLRKTIADTHLIQLSSNKHPTMQQWCSFVDTRKIDFSSS